MENSKSLFFENIDKKANKKIFVVVSGSYSSYRIEGVFTSRYRAYKAFGVKMKHCRIEVYNLNNKCDTI